MKSPVDKKAEKDKAIKDELNKGEHYEFDTAAPVLRVRSASIATLSEIINTACKHGMVRSSVQSRQSPTGVTLYRVDLGYPGLLDNKASRRRLKIAKDVIDSEYGLELQRQFSGCQII